MILNLKNIWVYIFTLVKWKLFWVSYFLRGIRPIKIQKVATESKWTHKASTHTFWVDICDSRLVFTLQRCFSASALISSTWLRCKVLCSSKDLMISSRFCSVFFLCSSYYDTKLFYFLYAFYNKTSKMKKTTRNKTKWPPRGINAGKNEMQNRHINALPS